MVLKFQVASFNRLGEKCNPVPYKRTTQASKWNKAYRAYIDWKILIQNNFHQNFPKFSKASRIVKRMKPIEKSDLRWRVETQIFFKNDKHGDPDNVHKGVLDALFECDKKISGAYDFDLDPENPRVEIIIVGMEDRP